MMFMKVKILSLTEDKVRFLLEGVDVAFTNAFRRTIISEVPCMAIDDLFIFDNSSAIPDEVLAHRMGLIPLKTNLEKYVLPDECDCGSDLGCEKCRVVLTLDVEAKDESRTVYSGDFISEDPEVVPVSPDIPITKLAPNHAIRLEAYAMLGKGKTHAKWQPATAAIYQNVAQIEIDENRCNACGACLDACPGGVFSLNQGKVKVDNIYACTLCGDCVKACPIDPTAVEQQMLDNLYLFTVETNKCLPPEKIVTEAAKIIISKLNEFVDKIERGETTEEITDFEITELEAGRLYSVGGDFDEESEEEDNKPGAYENDPNP
jgi:DNA-directed RNA polymerase subunit D